ncbi:hypothetical protein SARC_14565, partial [Sphaeroforma arctica JP610]
RFAHIPVKGFNNEVKNIICPGERTKTHPNVTATICWNQGTYEFAQGDYDKARVCYTRTVMRAEQDGNDVNEMDTARYALAHMLYNGMVGEKELADYTDAYNYLKCTSSECVECQLKLAYYFYEIKRDDPLAEFKDPTTGETGGLKVG